MKKKPFHITFRKDIEEGKYKVVTREGNDVTILRWDMNAMDYPILAVVKDKDGKEAAIIKDEYGRESEEWDDDDDLFLIDTSEPKMTEFESKLYDFVNEVRSVELSYDEIVDCIKSWSEKLQHAAREGYCPVETLQAEYSKGRADEQKDMPSWRKAQCKLEIYSDELLVWKKTLEGTKIYLTNTVEPGERYMNVSELTRLRLD